MKLKELLTKENLELPDFEKQLSTLLETYTDFNLALEKDIKSLEIDINLKRRFIKKIKDTTYKELLLKSKMLRDINDNEQANSCAFAAFTSDKNLQTFWIYANSLIELVNISLCDGEFIETNRHIDTLEDLISDYPKFDQNAIFNNVKEVLKMSSRNYQTLQSKITDYSREIEKERWKTMEILAIFSSILSFVLVSINIITKIEITEAKSLLITFSLLLLTFPLTISLLLDNTLKEKRVRLLFLVLLISLLFANIIFPHGIQSFPH